MKVNSLCKTDVKVLGLLGDFDFHTKKEIASRIGKSEDAADGAVRRLRRKYGYNIIFRQLGVRLLSEKPENRSDLDDMSAMFGQLLANIKGNLSLGDPIRSLYKLAIEVLQLELSPQETDAYVKKLNDIAYLLIADQTRRAIEGNNVEET